MDKKMTNYLFIHLGSSAQNTLTKMYEIRSGNTGQYPFSTQY